MLQCWGVGQAERADGRRHPSNSGRGGTGGEGRLLPRGMDQAAGRHTTKRWWITWAHSPLRRNKLLTFLPPSA